MEISSLKIYTTLGKALCAVAGGLAAYLLGGPLFGLLGLALGALIGHALQKSVVNITN